VTQDPTRYGLPPYPQGDVAGPCVCGSWPGGPCLRCRRNTPPPLVWGGAIGAVMYVFAGALAIIAFVSVAGALMR
jgi:hypothetical protein